MARTQDGFNRPGSPLSLQYPNRNGSALPPFFSPSSLFSVKMKHRIKDTKGRLTITPPALSHSVFLFPLPCEKAN